MVKRKKSLQYKKQLKRLERDVKSDKINSSMLDELLEKQPQLVKKSEELQPPQKKKTPLQDKPQPKARKRQTQKLQKRNLSKTRDLQTSKKKKQKRTKQRTSYNRQISETSKVPKSEKEIDQQHQPISLNTVANSYVVAVEKVRKLCIYYSVNGTYTQNSNAIYLLKYFNATVSRLGNDEVGKALLSMDEQYISQCQVIIFESNQQASQDMTNYFIQMLVSLSGEQSDLWYIQELYEEQQFDDIYYE